MMTWLLGALAALTFTSNTVQVAAHANNFESNSNISTVAHQRKFKKNQITSQHNNLSSNEPTQLKNNALQTQDLSDILANPTGRLTGNYDLVDHITLKSAYNYFLLNPTSDSLSAQNTRKDYIHDFIKKQTSATNPDWGPVSTNKSEYIQVKDDNYNDISEIASDPKTGQLEDCYDFKMVSQSNTGYALVLNKTEYKVNNQNTVNIPMTLISTYSYYHHGNAYQVYNDATKKDGVSFKFSEQGQTAPSVFQLLDIISGNDSTFIALTTWGLYSITISYTNVSGTDIFTANTTSIDTLLNNPLSTDFQKYGISVGDLSNVSVIIDNQNWEIIMARIGYQTGKATYKFDLRAIGLRFDGNNIQSSLTINALSNNSLGWYVWTSQSSPKLLFKNYKDYLNYSLLNTSRDQESLPKIIISSTTQTIFGSLNYAINKSIPGKPPCFVSYIGPLYVEYSKTNNNLTLNLIESGVFEYQQGVLSGSTVGFLDNSGKYRAYIIYQTQDVDKNDNSPYLAMFTYDYTHTRMGSLTSDPIIYKIPNISTIRSQNKINNIFLSFDKYNLNTITSAHQKVENSVYLTFKSTSSLANESSSTIDELSATNNFWSSPIILNDATNISRLFFLNNIVLSTNSSRATLNNVIIAAGTITYDNNSSNNILAEYVVDYSNETDYLTKSLQIKVDTSNIVAIKEKPISESIINEANNLNQLENNSDSSAGFEIIREKVSEYYNDIATGKKTNVYNPEISALLKAYDGSNLKSPVFRTKLTDMLKVAIDQSQYQYTELVNSIISKITFVPNKIVFVSNTTINNAFTNDSNKSQFQFVYSDGNITANILKDLNISLKDDVWNSTLSDVPNIQQIANNVINGDNGLIQNWLLDTSGYNSLTLGLNLKTSSFVNINVGSTTLNNNLIKFTKFISENYAPNFEKLQKSAEIFNSSNISEFMGFDTYPTNYITYENAFNTNGIIGLIKIITNKAEDWDGYNIDINDPSSYTNDYLDLKIVTKKIDSLTAEIKETVNASQTKALPLLTDYLTNDLGANLYGYSITKLLSASNLDYHKFYYSDFIGQNKDNPTIYATLIAEAKTLHDIRVDTVIMAFTIPIGLILLIIAITVSAILYEKMNYDPKTKKITFHSYYGKVIYYKPRI